MAAGKKPVSAAVATPMPCSVGASFAAPAPTSQRRPPAQMCPEVVDGGECYMYSCEHCHSKVSCPASFVCREQLSYVS